MINFCDNCIKEAEVKGYELAGETFYLCEECGE